MYIIKNALKNISRSKGRTILIGIIVLVIAVSACIGLSIREAAESAKEDALSDLTITGQISVDRSAMMNNMQSDTQDGEPGSFDKSSFRDKMQNMGTISIDELLTYASLDSVETFYYTTTVSMNGDDSLEAVTTTDSSESDDAQTDAQPGRPDEMSQMKGGGGFAKGSMGTQGDFTIIGYSSDEAMTDFVNGTSNITDGEMFEEGTDKNDCVISDELAAYNNLSVGDTINVVNPNAEDETYTLTIAGIYNNTQSTVSDSTKMFGFSSSSDPANQIYMSYNALKNIITASSDNAETSTDENTGMEMTTALPNQVAGTYVFASVEEYNKFSEDVYTAGLSTDYAVTSNDLTAYENSILPLKNLSKMATYFLIVVLIIGAVVLVVINIFNVRERKYEVGVLTAIGMKKAKVSMQFIFETLVITIVAVVIGGMIGAVTSVPVTNSLLKSQIESQQNTVDEQEKSFGRGQGMPDMGQGGGRMDKFANAASSTNYVSKVTTATDVTVLLQLLGIGICLTLVASAASVVFIMRYDPLKILANRD